MAIAKSDNVWLMTDLSRGLGFVHYILSDGMALVEFVNNRREWIYTKDLSKAEV